MTLPKKKEIEMPLLREIAAMRGQARPKDVYVRLVAHFGLSQADLAEKKLNGTSKWENRVAFVRLQLVMKGQVARLPRGIWTITAEGRKRIGAVAAPAPAPRPPVGEPLPVQNEGRPPSQPFSHTQLIEMGSEMGHMLGKVVEVEAGPVYKHDISWKENQWANPYLVTEICDKGNLDKDIQSLNWAAQNWKARGILIIVDDKEYASVAKKLAGVPVLTLRAEDFVKLHSVANSAGADVLKLMFGAQNQGMPWVGKVSQRNHTGRMGRPQCPSA